MATSDKNIVITPNISSSTDDPKIVFSGADASTGAQNITMKMYPTNSGTLSIEGSAGQLFSVVNSLSGTIFAVSDVSGIPSIEVLDTGLVKINQYNGDTNIGGIYGTSGTRLTVKGYSDSWNTTTPGTTKGTIHIDIYGSSGSTDGGAITFSAKDSTNPAQAGIYVTSSGSFGTRMYFATTDSYATGSKTAVSISEGGVVNFPRARPTYAGYTILDTNNIGSYAAATNQTMYIGTTAVAINRSSASLSLTGVSIDGSAGSAGSVTNGFYTTSTFYLGTTSIAVNRSSASQSLTGVSIDGSAGSVTNGFYTTSSFYLGTTSITVNRSSASQSLTGVSIDGSAGSVSGLTLSASGSGVVPDNVTQNQLGYNTSVSLLGQTDGALYSSAHSSSWIHQIYGDFRTGQIMVRGKNSNTWQSWLNIPTLGKTLVLCR